MPHHVVLAFAGDLSVVGNFLQLIWLGLHKPSRWIALPGLAGLYVLLRFLPSNEKLAPYQPVARRFLLIAAMGVIAVVGALNVFYLLSPYLLDKYATLYACISWLAWTTDAVYQDLNTSFRYSFCYGPYGYFLTGALEHFFGGVFSAKLSPFVAGMGSFVLLYGALRRRVDLTLALLLTAVGLSLPLSLDWFQFWPRPDPYMLFCVALGFWLMTRKSGLSWVVLGVLSGFCINLKIHAFAYLLPLVAMKLQQDFRVRSILAAGVVGIVVALLPFLVFRNVSLVHFLVLLHAAAGHPTVAGFWIKLIEWGLLFVGIGLFPLIFWRVTKTQAVSVLKKNMFLAGGLITGMAIVAYPASLLGAGPHHLIPFLPSVLYLAASLFADIQRLEPPPAVSRWGSGMVLSGLTLIFVAAIMAASSLFAFIHQENPLVRAQLADLEHIQGENKNAVILNAPSLDEDSRDDAARLVLVMKGMPIGADPCAVMDWAENKLPGLRFDDLEREIEKRSPGPVIWICRRDAPPFQVRSNYHLESDTSVYSDQFIQDFHKNFFLAESTSCFDIYRKSAP